MLFQISLKASDGQNSAIETYLHLQRRGFLSIEPFFRIVMELYFRFHFSFWCLCFLPYIVKMLYNSYVIADETLLKLYFIINQFLFPLFILDEFVIESHKTFCRCSFLLSEICCRITCGLKS